MKHRDESVGQSLPLPPAELVYYGSVDRYLESGQGDASTLRKLFDRLGVRLSGISVMDWGCRDCRVLRHFEAEARSCDFWGVDQHGPTMEWVKENLSPPFRFVTCTAYPHLPFEDRTFDIIFAISVMTHVPWLADAWLMELRRILKPGAYGLLTIHDEHTWQFLRKDDAFREAFALEEEDIKKGETGDLVIIDGADVPLEYVNVFHSSERIRREWGQYFEIVAIEPCAFYHQAMVVVRKPIGAGGS